MPGLFGPCPNVGHCNRERGMKCPYDHVDDPGANSNDTIDQIMALKQNGRKNRSSSRKRSKKYDMRDMSRKSPRLDKNKETIGSTRMNIKKIVQARIDKRKLEILDDTEEEDSMGEDSSIENEATPDNTMQQLDANGDEKKENGDDCTHNSKTKPDQKSMHNALNQLTRKSRTYALEPVYGQNTRYRKTGLKNMGNTCYVNAILQCLVKTEPLVRILQAPSNQSSQSSQLSMPPGMRNELWFLSLVIKNGNYRCVSPTDFLDMLQQCKPELDMRRQQDVHETIITILNEIEEELGDDAKQLKDIFDGKTKITFRCKECGTESVKMDDCRYLHLNIPTKRYATLAECYENYKMPELISKRCPNEKCRYSFASEEEKTTYKEVVLDQTPNILMIQLRRFGNDTGTMWRNKMNTYVDFPLNMKLEKASYNLYGVISHTGTQTSGHYTAQCEDETNPGTWHCYDDPDTRILDGGISKSGAYILFYRKNEERKQKEQKEEKKDDEQLIRRSNREPKPSEKIREQERCARMKEDKVEKQNEGHCKGKNSGEAENPKEMQKDSKVEEKKEADNADARQNKEDQSEGPTKDDDERCAEIVGEKICVCQKPYDARKPTLRCDDCHKWFHGGCVDYSCKQCMKMKKDEEKKEKDELHQKHKTQIENLKDNLKNKTMELKEAKTKENEASKSDRENKKKNAKQATEIENLMKEKEKIISESKKTTTEMKKEIENLKLEVTGLVNQVQELKMELKEAGKEDSRITETGKDDSSSRTEEEGTKEAEAEEKESSAGESNEEEKMRMSGDHERELNGTPRELNGTEQENQHVPIIPCNDNDLKKETKKLKAEVARYETRLESTLNQLALKDRTLLVLLDDHEMILKINEELEKQVITLQNKLETAAQSNDQTADNRKALPKKRGPKPNYPRSRKLETVPEEMGTETGNETGNEKNADNHHTEDVDRSNARKREHQPEKQAEKAEEPPDPDPDEDDAATEDCSAGKAQRKLRNNTLCRYYLNGYCRNGPDCRFSHKAEEPWSIDGNIKERGTAKKDVKGIRNKSGKSEDQNERNLSGQDAPQCSQLPGCKFLQEIEEQLQEAPRDVDEKMWDKNENVEEIPRERQESHDIPCRFHLHGRCTKGDGCRFSHQKAESLKKIDIVKVNLNKAFAGAESDIKGNTMTKNLEKGMQLQKLYSLKKTMYEALKNLARKVKTMNLTL